MCFAPPTPGDVTSGTGWGSPSSKIETGNGVVAPGCPEKSKNQEEVMDREIQERIVARGHAIWVAHGRPLGCDAAYLDQASRELALG